MLLRGIDGSEIKGELPLRRYVQIRFQPKGVPLDLALTFDNKVLVIVETCP
jgi:hypothetical protein